MWFKILFYPHLPHVSAAIAEDGTVRFKADDVGKLLGYSNYYFASRKRSTDFDCTLPEKLRAGKRIMVLTFEEILKKIVLARNKKKTSISIEEFHSLWHDGRAANSIVPNFPIVTFKFAPLLRVERDATYRIQDWIEAYRRVVMRFYKHVRSLENPCTSDHAHLDVPPSSVESDYFYEPPQDVDDMVIDETNLVTGHHEGMKSSDHEGMKSSDLRETKSSDHRGMKSSDHEDMKSSDLQETKLSRTQNVENPDLKMYFEKFPPRQIQIQIHDTRFDYRLME